MQVQQTETKNPSKLVRFSDYAVIHVLLLLLHICVLVCLLKALSKQADYGWVAAYSQLFAACKLPTRVKFLRPL